MPGTGTDSGWRKDLFQDSGRTSRSGAVIGIDWGTTSLRAVLMRGDGRVVDSRSGPQGILSVADKAFEAVMANVIGEWERDHAAAPLIASGMITSRQGWVETPYVPCPAGAAELAGAIARHRTPSGRLVHFVTGLSIRRSDGVPDVMRGEETQVIGALLHQPDLRLAVMPGTHSKWVRVDNGRIVWFQTFMTGEVFAALKDHTILGRLMEGGADDMDAFDKGLKDGSRTGSAGALLGRLFAVRTLGLFGDLTSEALSSYLSGLLIGAEIAEGRAAGGLDAASELTIIAEPALARRYQRAFEALGQGARIAEDGSAARGQLAVARLAGLLA